MSKITKKQATAAVATATEKKEEGNMAKITAAAKAREELEWLIKEQNRLAKKAKMDAHVNGDISI